LRVGIIALQGALAPHRRALERLGHEVAFVRLPKDLVDVHGLVLPGGESTAQRLLTTSALSVAIAEKIRRGAPTLGTCAGLIALVRLGLLDVEVARNGWGPQVHSRCALADSGDDRAPLSVVLIRAPRILDTGADVQTLARYRGEPVWVRQGTVHGTTFHPELTADPRVHAAVFG